jgi:translation initiation factor IF-3
MAFNKSQSKERPLLVNDQIKAPTMLVLDDDGGTIGTMSRRDTQKLALEQEKDIVQIHYNFKEKIATVKLVDLGQYLYDLKKKQKEQKKTQKK